MKNSNLANINGLFPVHRMAPIGLTRVHRIEKTNDDNRMDGKQSYDNALNVELLDVMPLEVDPDDMHLDDELSDVFNWGNNQPDIIRSNVEQSDDVNDDEQLNDLDLDHIQSDGKKKKKKKKKKKSIKHKERKLKERMEKELKKHKKKGDKKALEYSERFETDTRSYNSGQLLSNIMNNAFRIKVVRNNIYVYNEVTGYYSLFSKQAVQTLIMSWIKENRKDADKISSRDLDEAYKSLFVNAEIQCESIDKAYNKPDVLCLNGVLDVETMKLKENSPKYEFTSGINARYDEDAEGEAFNGYIDYVTNNDKELKGLLQEVLGYILSNYTNIRTAFVFLGIKGTGKSLLLDIIRSLVGRENTSNVNIQEMENEYYAANILENKINIAPDTPAAPIKGEISKFKSFTSKLDVTSGRNPYFPVFNARCRSKFLFGTNHHFSFAGIGRDDLEAFFDRMVYIPFNRPISDDKRDVSLNTKLADEYDYIFTWAMQGLKRLIDNNFKLSYCKASDELKVSAMAQYCPEQIFFDHCIKRVENERFESSKAITIAFEAFCHERNVGGKYNIAEYLSQRNINKVRKRIDADGYKVSDKNTNPIYVFEGIRLRNKYRV